MSECELLQVGTVSTPALRKTASWAMEQMS